MGQPPPSATRRNHKGGRHIPQAQRHIKGEIETREMLIDGQPVTLVVRVNRRAKRLILKVDTVGERILVTAPSQRAKAEAIAFAAARRDWIGAQLATRPKAAPFTPEAIFPFLGEPHRIINAGPPRAPIRRAEPTGGLPGVVRVGGDHGHVNRRVRDWLKREARRTLTARSDHFAVRLGVKRGPISIRDTRSRWGSCSSAGALSYSWRLIMAPPAIIDYVAAHECSHLVHLDHSLAFWRLVRGLGVDPDAAAAWFATSGEALYAYGVDAAPKASEAFGKVG